MLKVSIKYVLLICLLNFFFLSCGSGSDETDISPTDVDSELSERINRVGSFLKTQDLSLVNHVKSPNGHVGYLAEYKNLKHSLGEFKKYCIILTGTSFSMGFQAAYLRPHATYRVLTEFKEKTALSQMKTVGLNEEYGTSEGDLIINWVQDKISGITNISEPKIPQYMKDEMNGIIEGLYKADEDYEDVIKGEDVAFNDVVALNQGIDGIFYLIASLLDQTPNNSANNILQESFAQLKSDLATLKMAQIEDLETPLSSLDYENIGIPKTGCNQFIVSGKATRTGETFHGRDFMFDSAGVLEETLSMMVYLPDKGIPFVSVNSPGFIGQTVGVNLDGVSIGQAVSPGIPFGNDIGMGAQLIVRHILQSSENLKEAVEQVKNSPRGVGWIYAIADDEEDPNFGPGIVLETSASDREFTGLEQLPFWQQLIPSLREATRMLDEKRVSTLDRGVAVRGAKYELLEEFLEFSSSLMIYNPFDGQLILRNIELCFYPQKETYADVIANTNHFLTPRIRFSQFYPFIAFLYSPNGILADSAWRYERVIENIDTYYGNIDYFGSNSEIPDKGSAAWILDFFNTGANDFLGSDVVESHRTIINNSTKEIRGLFGSKNDPWVNIKLIEFVNFFWAL